MTTIAPPSPTETDPEWRRPGPGSWALDLDHTGPTPSRPVRDLYPVAAATGMAAAFELLGGPLATMEMAFVNGRLYRRFRPAVGGDRDLPTPPSVVLWAAARLHPEFRRRDRAARRALADRIWLEELDRWEREWRPSIVERNDAFSRVEPLTLDDAHLADHLDELWSHLVQTTTLHFRLHGTDVGPIGLLVSRTDELGIDRPAVFAALAGASPSTNEPALALADLHLRAKAAAAGAPIPATLDAIRALDDDLAEAVDAFVQRYGWRLTTGYDLTDRALVELPGVLPAAIGGTGGAAHPEVRRDAEARGEAAGAALLARVPEDRRDELAVALADARRCYGLRDENGPLTYEWPAGLLRRGLLESARRLCATGALADPAHVFDLTVAEVMQLLRGAAGPTADEIARRHDVRCSWAALEPPATLGPDDTLPPPWTLPAAMRRLTTATVAVMDLLLTDHRGTLRGLGIGTTTHTGTARVVTDALEALERVAPGDVLVTTATVPTFNAVLAVAGAAVIEEGGLLSHAAVMARELGFPAVVGAQDATTAIPDGATVEVDPVAGVVRVLT